MNFLSHYYIDREVDVPAFTLGKILPDLLRIHGTRKRIRLEHKRSELDETQIQVMLGVDHHILVDKYWHNSGHFNHYSGKIKAFFREYSFDNIHKYYYFYAHILLELMLDRLLINHNREIAVNFYDHLGQIKLETIQAFFRYNRLPADAEGFFRFFTRFVQSEYLFSYPDNERIIFALGRISQRAGLEPFSENDHLKMQEIVEQTERILTDHYLKIFHTIKEKLSG